MHPSTFPVCEHDKKTDRVLPSFHTGVSYNHHLPSWVLVTIIVVIGMTIVNTVIMVPILLLPTTAAIIMVILVIVVVSVVVVTILISVGMLSFVWAVSVVPVSRRGRPGASR